MKVLDPIRVSDPMAKVEELIGSNIKKFNRELVFNCLSNYEAMQVLKIPLSLRLLNDRLVWH